MSEIIFNSPYPSTLKDKVQKYYFASDGVTVAFDDARKLTPNLALGELRKSSYVLDSEKNLFAYTIVHNDLLKAFQVLRTYLKKPITVNSSFRSVGYELSKGRTGTSQHTNGLAFDLSGVGLVDLLKNALETKNELYTQLRAAGVNGFGIYEKQDFVHIDVREPKVDGGYALWFGNEDGDLKKKDSYTLTKIIVLPVLFVLLAVGLFKKFKDWRR